jgi:mannose-6-phosphate isomerase-like protein (cupin superfamily)
VSGEVAVIEIGASPERKGPSLHHRDFDETFYILDGETTRRWPWTRFRELTVRELDASVKE